MERITLSELDGYPHDVVLEEGPRTVRLALEAGDGVATHSHPGRDVLIHVYEGTVDVTLDGETERVEAGELVRFDGEREVAPTAVTDAEALVVLAPRDDGD